MQVLRIVMVLTSVMAAACFAAPMPEGAGRGVIAFDPAPPAGATVFERPTMRVGDRYALLRGGQTRLSFSVVVVDETGVVVEDSAGHQLRRDQNLGYLGEWDPKGEAVHLLSPADTRFHWPLWVGKSWRCEYMDRKPESSAMRLVVAYVVEELDRITVPAGTFDALRIARVETLQVEGETYFDRTSLSWYAPSIGLEVRQLLGDTAFELVEWTRAGS